MATLTFKVLLPSGASAGSGATVKVMDMWSEKLFASGTTNSFGIVNISWITGEYMVNAEKSGYAPSYPTHFKFVEAETGKTWELWLQEIAKPSPPKPTTTVTKTTTAPATATTSIEEKKSAGVSGGAGGLTLQQLTEGMTTETEAQTDILKLLRENALLIIVGIIAFIVVVEVVK